MTPDEVRKSGLLHYGMTPERYEQAMMWAGLAPMNATVFHGSPHRFNRFDASKIGTGEGALAYGHGLYFAENPNVAKSYATPNRESGAWEIAGNAKIHQHRLPFWSDADIGRLDVAVKYWRIE